MNENDNITFYELVQKKSIKIPIIQRDYAQGRTSNKEICCNFLKAIKESILNHSTINLDFVYGNISEDIFYPLDGQQRLTTLFLLHWYAFIKEKPNDLQIQNSLKNFSYETRMSSRRFCEAIVTKGISIKKEEKLSELILDSEWFFISWKQDPTIWAMLNTIDMIHDLFYDIDHLWEAFTDKKLITFHLLILENFGLSDDLYIKMNARGRLLTPFESLKAEIQDKAAKNNWEIDRDPIERFSYKIDQEWTDFMWTHFRKSNLVDESHMNFITTLVMICLSMDSKSKSTERTEALKKLNENNLERSLIHYIDQDTFSYIYKCYELYSRLVSNQSIPDLSFDMWRHKPEKNLLYQILLGNHTSYTHKVLFYAQTEYLLRNQQIETEKLTDWMRVVRNIVSRADITKEGKRPDIIRSPETFYGAINLINEIASGSNDIYHYLYSHSINSAFAKEQMKEEVLKAKIIVTHPDYKQLIFDTEDNELLRGKIMFALKCAGYQTEIAEIDFLRLNQIKDVFKQYFNKDLESVSMDEFDLLRRAMLTIEADGKYQFYTYWCSYWHAGQADKYKLFPIFREIEYFIGDKYYSIYFMKLVELLIYQTYKDMIDHFTKPEDMENWQYRLIKEEDLLRNCQSKYIAIPNDRSCCYLLKSKRTSDIEGSPKIQ